MLVTMTEGDRRRRDPSRRDPRAEPDGDDSSVERPFERPSSGHRLPEDSSNARLRALVVEETRSPLRDARRDASVVDEGELGAPPHRVARPVVDASASIDTPLDAPIDTASDASLETPIEPLESRSLPRSTPPPPTIGVDTRALSSAPPPPLDSVSIALNAANASSATRAASGTGGVPLASVERFIDEGRWDVLSDMLEASARAGELPPHLMMVYAVARAEAHPEDAGLVALAIKASADAYGVPEASPIACLLAKRTLRRTPREWGKRPAPRGTISTIIVFVALVLGGGGGFWLSTTKVQIPLPAFLLSR